MHTRFDHTQQRHVMTDTRPPANAFEWKRYVVEESVRRGDHGALNANETSRKRSLAASKAIERIREDTPTYGTLAISGKTAAMLAQKPKKFKVLKQ